LLLFWEYAIIVLVNGMAEDIEFKVRAILEDELSNALASMSRRTQDAFSTISRQLQVTTASTRNLRQETKQLNDVFSKTSYSGRTVGQSMSYLTNNIFSLRKSIQEARSASKLLNSSLDEIKKRRSALLSVQKMEQKAGSDGNQAIIASAKASIKALRDQEREIRRVKNAFDSISTNAFRLQLSTLNKDIGLVGKSMVDFGKNLNYVGRNLTFALTLPILGFVRYGIDNLRKLDKEVVRTRKIINDAFASDAELDTFMNQLSDELDNLSYKVTDSYTGLGIARELVQGLAADFAQLGVPAGEIFPLVRLTAELEKIGDVDIGVAREFILSQFQQAVRIQNTAASEAGKIIDTAETAERAVNMITGSLYQLNLIENKTVLSLKSMADAFPEMQGIATTFGLTILEAASMFAPMVAAGFEVGASANSIKVSLQRIVAPTKQNKEIMAELGRALGKDFQFEAGIGLETIQYLVDGFDALKESSYGTQGALEFFARLFGVRQGPRMEQAINQLSIFQNQLRQAGSDVNKIFGTVVGSINTELEKIGISDRFSADTIQSLGEIARYSSEAQIAGNDAVVKAITDGQLNAIKQLDDQYENFYGSITNEAGKVLLAQALGPEAAKDIYKKELEAANNTVEAKLGRLRETFKALSAQVVPVFVEMAEAITPLIQRFVRWFTGLSDGAKKLFGIGLAALALAGPLTTLKSILAQIVGVVLQMTSKILPKLFKFLKFPKVISDGAVQAAGGIGEMTSRMGLFGKTLDAVAGKFPKFANALDYAFGGIGSYRQDVIQLGNTTLGMGRGRSNLVRMLLGSGKLSTVARSDLDILANQIVDQTTVSVGRRSRVKQGSGNILSSLLGLNRISGWFKNPVNEIIDGLNGVAKAEDYVSSYIQQATAFLATQAKTGNTKARSMRNVKNAVDGVTKAEKEAGYTIKKTTQATAASTMPTVISKRRTGDRPVGTGYGSLVSEKDVRAQRLIPPVTIPGIAKLNQEIEKELERIKGLSRKGPRSVTAGWERLFGKAGKLGVSPQDASTALLGFTDRANALIQKPGKAVSEAVSKSVETTLDKLTGMMPLTSEAILSSFSQYNDSITKSGGKVSDIVKITQSKIAQKLGSAGLTFQSDTLKGILDEFSKGTVLNVGGVIDTLEAGATPTKKQFKDLFRGFGRGTSAKLFPSNIKDDIQAMILGDKDIIKAIKRAPVTAVDYAVEATKDLYDDFEEGTTMQFLDRVKKLEEDASDPKSRRRIRDLTKGILQKTTGPAYYSDYIPERKRARLGTLHLEEASIKEAESLRRKIADLEAARASVERAAERSVSEALSQSYTPRTVDEFINDAKRGVFEPREGMSKAEATAVKSGFGAGYQRRLKKIDEDISKARARLGLVSKQAPGFYARNMPLPKTLDELEDIASGIGRLGDAPIVDVIGDRRPSDFSYEALQSVRGARIEREMGMPFRQVGEGGIIRSRGRNVRDLILRGRKKMAEEARRKFAFMSRKQYPGLWAAADMLKKNTGLMSMLPLAALGPALAGMADVPGGLLGKLFGGGAAGAAMMAVGGGIGGGGLEETLLDKLLAKRVGDPKKAKDFKKAIIAKLTSLGGEGKSYLDILTQPLSALGDQVDDLVSGLPDVVRPKKSVSRITDIISKGPEAIAKNVNHVVDTAARSLDQIIGPDGDIANVGSNIDNMLNRSISVSQKRSAANIKESVDEVKKSTKEIRPERYLQNISDSITDPLEKLNAAKDEAVKDIVKQARTRSTERKPRIDALRRIGQDLGLSDEAIDGVLKSFSDDIATVNKSLGRTPSGAKIQGEGRKSVQAVEEKVTKTRKKASETVKTAITKDIWDAAEEAKDAAIAASRVPVPSAGQLIYERGMAQIEEAKAKAKAVVAKDIWDDVAETADEAAAAVVVGTQTTSTPTPPPPTRQTRHVKRTRRVVGATVAKAGYDYVQMMHDAAMAHALASMGMSMAGAGAIAGAATGAARGRVATAIGRGLTTPFTKLGNSVSYATIAFGRFSSVFLGFIPIFGKMISQGLVRSGVGALNASRGVSGGLRSRVDATEWGKVGKTFGKIGADFTGMLVGFARLLNPLGVIAGLVKSIVTGLKIALMASGIGILIGLLVAAVIAVKSSIQNFEPIIAKLKEAWGYIKEALQIIAKPLMDMILAFAGASASAKNTGDSLEDSANSSRSAFSAIVIGINFIAKKFRENADKIAKFVKEKVVPVLVSIVNTVISIGKVIYFVFTGQFDKAGDAGAEMFMRIGHAFLSLVKTVVPILKSLLQAAIVGFGKLADFIFTAITKAISAALEWGTSKLGGWIVGAGKWIANSIFLTPGTFDNSFWSWGGSLLEKGWDGLWGKVFGDDKAENAGRQAGQDLANGMWEEYYNSRIEAGMADEFTSRLMDQDVNLGDWLLEKLDFDQGWIESIVGGLLDGVDWLANGLIGAIDSALESIAESFKKKFGREIDVPISLTPDGEKSELQKEIDELVSEISGALEGTGEEIGNAVGGAVKDALKDLQQRFVDLVVDYLGDRVSKYKSQLTELLEEQKEKQLQYFDDQLAALDALEKAEEELTETKDYETGRRRMIEDRDLQRAKYQRERALAIYEGRVDDARTLDLEEEKNTKSFRDELDQYDGDRAKQLQSRQRETVKQILEQQKKDAEKAFDEIIKNYEKFVEDIGKYGTYNQEELAKQFEEIRGKAAEATAAMQTSFREYYLEIPKIIQQYTDPTVGFFSEPLDKLISIAKTKFGLGADSGASADSILGNTAALMREIGQTFIDMGPTAGQSFETAFSAVIDNYITPIVDKMQEAFFGFDIAAIFQEAIDNANMVLIREQQKLIDGMGSLVKDMISLLDPAIAKWYALQAAIEAAAGAAKSSGGSTGGGGFDPGDGAPVVNISQSITSFFNKLFPRSAFESGSEGTIARNTVLTKLMSTLPAFISDVSTGKYTISALLNYLAPNTGINMYLRKFLQDSGFLSAVGVSRYFGGVIPSFGYGGKMKKYGLGGFAVPGFASTAVPALLHGGEYVVNAKAVQAIGMSTLQNLNNMRFTSPGRMQSPQVTTINETKNVNIYVDNFIGEQQWFESMMKEYNVKVAPRNQKSAGLEVRTVSSYSGLNRGL
jgi:TP901 family phage tail tape measure protein